MSDTLCPPDSSLVDLIEAVRALRYGRPSDRTVEGMLREHCGTCSTKHLFLARCRARRRSRPGVSRHLRVLRERGLISVREQGQRRLYSLEPAPLDELDGWLERYRPFWSNRHDEGRSQMLTAVRR
jgi:DNA-binding transcriptional ArsR family regulator